MRKLLMSAAALAAAAVATPSNAAVTFSFWGGQSVTGVGLSIIKDFSTSAGIVGTEGTDYVIHAGSPNDSQGAAPYYGDGSSYLAVLASGTATVTNLPATSFIAFDIGSMDTYNTLEIFYTTLTGSGSISFSPPPPADGNQTVSATNGLFMIRGDAGEVFTSLSFKSGLNSFEVDNLAVPEASTWAMMLVGLGAVGFAMRRQKVSVSFA